MSEPTHDLNALRQAIVSGDPSQAMPALARLRNVPEAEAIPLLLLGLQQSTFMVRSLGCAGLGVKRSEEGWVALVEAMQEDPDANVRAEASSALANYGVERSWPLLRAQFEKDGHWLVRCSILSALADQPAMPMDWQLELARLAVGDGDGTVRTSGAEVLVRLVREGGEAESAREARGILVNLQSDTDHRVVAAALNGLQG